MRTSQIVSLGLSEEVTELYEELGTYTDVSRELARQGYDVSADQVRYFLSGLDGITPYKGDWTPPDPPETPSIYDAGRIYQDVLDQLYAIMRSPESQSTAIQTAKEIRGTVESYVKTQERINDVANLAQFMRDTVEVVGEADKALREKIRAAFPDNPELADYIIDELDFSLQDEIYERTRKRRALRLPEDAARLLDN